MEPQGLLDAESDVGVLVPSPQSETVTHEMEELSLQPSQNLPPLNERKNVLQLRLQQRRTREQLVDQGIMPPLKSPAAFHEQIRSLERARTENFLKHKIRSRPERSELVRMHILQETLAEPSLQATQLKLKRARLADDLNEKIAQRPGPMELVEKNILPVDSSVKEAIIVGQVNYPKTLDMYPFEEDSSDALSPEQPASQESQGSAPSPGEPRPVEASPPLLSSTMQYHPAVSQPKTELPKPVSTSDQPAARLAAAPQSITIPAPSKPGPTLVKGQAGTSSVALNSNGGLTNSIVVSLPTAAPARPNNTLANRKPGPLPANLEDMKVAELKMELKLRGLPVSGTKTDLIERLRPFQESTSATTVPPPSFTGGTLSPSAMEVNASSTVQRLSPIQQGVPESMNSTPPASPMPLELCTVAAEEASVAEPSKSAPVMSPRKEVPEEKDRRLHEKERQIEELMRRLEQEQRLVEELKMQLEVEKRGQQAGPALEQSPPAPVKEEKSISQNCLATWSPLTQPPVVKQEEPASNPAPGPIPPVSLPPFFIHPNVPQVLGQPQTLIPTQPGTTQILVPVSLPTTGTTIQLPSTTVSLQTQQIVQATVPTQAQDLIQPSVPKMISQKAENSGPQHLPNQNHHLTKTFPVCTTSASGLQYNPNQTRVMKEIPQCFLNSSPEGRSSTSLPNGPVNKVLFSILCAIVPTLNAGFMYKRIQYVVQLRKECLPQTPSPSPPTFILQSSGFTGHAPKSKDPPRYEEAVKQTRSMQTQVPTATSQQMDDLFDILIESGEISPFIRQDLPPLTKTLPVTASITTLPINTVLSRPPPQVQVAPPPSLTLDSTPSLATLASDNQLEAFLEGTLSGEPEPRTLGLADELHCQLLDNPHSPMDTSELPFIDPTPPCSFDLHDTALDNM
ncbi:MKL/myocardin-like protein 2-like, partial [Scleropages formosus]